MVEIQVSIRLDMESGGRIGDLPRAANFMLSGN
jgi:hypothetical protein